MTLATKAQTEYFKNVPKIQLEGTGSHKSLPFRWYDANNMVARTSMKAWMRFACAHWLAFTGSGPDPFGEPTHLS